MKIKEARKNIGKLVMSTDAGRKLIRCIKPHGPYILTKITKAGLAMLEGYEYRVAPSYLCFPDVDVFFENDGSPKLCTRCGSEKIEEKILGMVDVLNGMGPTSELECICANCGSILGYWAYGAWDCSFKHGYEDLYRM